MMSILIFLVVLSILILVHESGHFFAARKVGVRVERFALGFGPKLFSVKRGDTEYALCAIPFGGYVKMSGDERQEFHNKNYEYLSKEPLDRFKIVFAGAFLNYVFAFVLFYSVFFLGYPTLTTKIGGLLDDFPAKESGLAVGDKIIAIDGKKVNSWEEMAKIIQAKSEEQVNLIALRGAKEIEIMTRVKVREFKDIFGDTKRIGLIGIIPEGEIVYVKHGLFESLRLATQKQLFLTGMTYKSIWFMLIGAMSFKETVSGPLGIFQVTTQAASFGILPLMQVMAIISLSLAIFNLLPLPILDGGHILLLGIERLRKKPLSPKVENVLSQVGLTFLITLVVLVTINDLQRAGFFEKAQGFISSFKK